MQVRRLWEKSALCASMKWSLKGRSPRKVMNICITRANYANSILNEFTVDCTLGIQAFWAFCARQRISLAVVTVYLCMYHDYVMLHRKEGADEVLGNGIHQWRLYSISNG